VTGRSPLRERSQLTLVVAATALALVWFLPSISFVVAQDSGSVPETTTTIFTSTSTTSTTLAPTTTTTTTTPVVLPVIDTARTILLELGTPVAAPGDPVGGSGQGNPNTDITLTFCSTCVTLGTVHANADGNFLFTFNVPLETTPGVHTVFAAGPGGEQGSASLTVTDPARASSTGYPLPVIPYGATPIAPVGPAVPTSSTGTPALTGLNVWGLTLLAAAALALGGMALMFGRLQPLIELPGRNRRRPQWAHRPPRTLLRLPVLDGADVVQVAVCVALAVALGLSLARQ
jgi:hypothetical protein